MTVAAPLMFPGAGPPAALALAAAAGPQDPTIAFGAASVPGGFLVELLAWGSALNDDAGPANLKVPEEISRGAELLIVAGARAAAALPAGEPAEASDDVPLRAASLLTPALAAVAGAPPSQEVPPEAAELVAPPGSGRLFDAPGSPASGEAHAPSLLSVRPAFAASPPAGPGHSSLPAAPAAPIQAPHPAVQPTETLPASAQFALSAAADLPEAESARGELALAMAVTQKVPAQLLEASLAPEASAPEAATTGDRSLAKDGPPSAGAAHRPARTAQAARAPEAARAAHGEIISMPPRGAPGEPQAEPVRPVPATSAALGPAASPGDSGLNGLRGEAQPLARPSAAPDAAPASPFQGSRAMVPLDAPRMASPAPVRRIEVRLERQAAEAVTVEVAERGGRIALQLRTPDRELAASLGEQACEIVRRLEAAGFRAQAWTPHQMVRPAEARLEFTPHGAPQFGNQAGDPGQDGAGRHPGEQDEREPDSEFTLEQFLRPDSSGKEIDS